MEAIEKIKEQKKLDNVDKAAFVTGTATGAIAATGAVATLTLDYGTAKNPIKVKGLVATDFLLYNTTTSTTVTKTVTETADGVYAFVYTTITGSTDVIKLSLAKNGYVGYKTYIDA